MSIIMMSAQMKCLFVQRGGNDHIDASVLAHLNCLYDAAIGRIPACSRYGARNYLVAKF